MSGRVEDSLNKLETALSRLQEAPAEEPSNALYLEGTIQRFEFVFELAWKTLKRALEVEGLICKTPRETFKTAYQKDGVGKSHALRSQQICPFRRVELLADGTLRFLWRAL